MPANEEAIATDSIVRACQEYVADVLGTTPEQIDPNADFDRLGVDSSLAVALLGELEERYDVDLPPEALFDDPTINAVAGYIQNEMQAQV